MNLWKRNIILILLIRVCFSLLFCVSVITIYWRTYGLNLFDMFLLQALFAISIVLFEIPTGYIGDRLGRKKTLILSALTATLAWAFYAWAGGFWEFVLTEVILGIAFSLLSGTDSSLLYESLKEMNRESAYTRVLGRQESMVFFAESLSAVTGGFLAALAPLEVIILLSSSATFIGFIAALFLHEPHREAYFHPRGTLYGLYKIARYVFLRSRMVRYVVPLMAVSSLSTMLGVWLYQPLWKEKNIPVWLFGILWACLSLPAALSSRCANAWERILGRKVIICLFPVPVVSGYLCAALVPGYAGVAFIYLTTLLRGLVMPILSKYIHEETFSDKRATVLSVQSWLFRFTYFLFAPLVGYVGEHYSISRALIVSAVISLILITAFMIPVIRRVDLNYANDGA